MGVIGTGAAQPVLSLCAHPWRLFGSFLPGQKGTRPAGRKPAPSSAPVCALGHLPPRGKAYGRLIAAPTGKKGGETPKKEKIPAVPGKEQRGLNLRKTEKRLLLVRGFLSPGDSQAQLIQLLVVRPQNAGILWGPVGIKMLGRNEFALRQSFALAGKTLVRRIRAAPSAMGPLRGRPGNVTPPRRSPLSG